jgi:DNA polymerase-3 subunit epsilon
MQKVFCAHYNNYMKRIYIDVETTGRDFRTCAIHELAGMIQVGGEIETFNFKMRPKDGATYDIPEDHPYLKPIRPQDLVDYPDQREIYQQFKTLLGKYVDPYDKLDKFHVIGYNVNFDIDFLRQWFVDNGDQYFGSWVWFPPIDVMILASTALAPVRHELLNFKLTTVYQYLFGESFEDSHEALADIIATKRVLGEVFSRLTKYGT